MVTLKDICRKITDGSHNPPAGIESSHYVMLSSKNIENDDITFDNPRFISKDDFFLENKRTNIEEDDLLLTIVGAIGRVAIVQKEHLPFCVQRSVAVLKLNRSKVLPRYAMYYLQSKKNLLEQESHGVAQKGVYLKQVEHIPFPLISLEKQEKIVQRLDSLQSIIKLKNFQLLKFDQLVKSRFVEMFGDPVTNSYKWRTCSLSEFGELNRGVSKHRPRNAPELLNGKYPLIQTGDIASSDLYITRYSSTYSEIGLRQSRMWPSGTLCITIAANIAKTAILTFDACFPDSVVGFHSKNSCTQLFIHFWFSFFQKILEEQAPESAQKNINLKILNNLQVIAPPQHLQEEFASFVQQVDKSKLAVKQSLKKLETLKNSLMQEYFG